MSLIKSAFDWYFMRQLVLAGYFGLTNKYPCISWWSAEQKFVQ